MAPLTSTCLIVLITHFELLGRREIAELCEAALKLRVVGRDLHCKLNALGLLVFTCLQRRALEQLEMRIRFQRERWSSHHAGLALL
jgi:hypothetical protein